MPDLAHSFVAILITDIIDARALLSSANTPVNRRHVVRATLAAVEGLAWYCREHIREVASQTGDLTPLADMALREQTYTVTEQGEILEQVRYLSLSTSIRLMVKQATQIAPPFRVDFGETGWKSLKDAIAIRNRTTHPKQIIDLELSDSDIDTIRVGFDWFLAVCVEMLEMTTASYAAFVEASHHLLDELKAGDPQALADYHAALLRSDD